VNEFKFGTAHFGKVEKRSNDYYMKYLLAHSNDTLSSMKYNAFRRIENAIPQTLRISKLHISVFWGFLGSIKF
jgi:hypothetical protein